MCAVLSCIAPVVAAQNSETTTRSESVTPVETPQDLPRWRNLDNWSFQAGIGFITGSTIDDLLVFDGDIAGEESGGEIYLLQTSLKLAEFEPELWGHRPKVDLELPIVLGIVDESRSDPFMQYSAGLTLRWKSFPWNEWVYTTFETGGGFTYSQQVLATERVRHPNRERSHLEFYWPVQLTLAHPRYREHQLVLLLHHHSGGGIFHTGGANTLGVAYRFVPGERMDE